VAFPQGIVGKPAPKRCKTFVYYNEAGSDGVAVVSAGLYSNHLHLALVTITDMQQTASKH